MLVHLEYYALFKETTMTTKTKQLSTIGKCVEFAGNILPILTILFFSTYYYFTTKFADLGEFNNLKDSVNIVEKDISLLQKEDITYAGKLALLGELEIRLRELERKVNLLIGRDDRPLPSDVSLELKGEIAMLRLMIENLRIEIKEMK